MADMTFIEITKDELKHLIRQSVEDALRELQAVAKEDRLLRISEVCELLHISKVTLHHWRKAGRIPYHRISSRIYFKKLEVLEAMKSISVGKMWRR